jgi:hypothetical protein
MVVQVIAAPTTISDRMQMGKFRQTPKGAIRFVAPKSQGRRNATAVQFTGRTINADHRLTRRTKRAVAAEIGYEGPCVSGDVSIPSNQCALGDNACACVLECTHPDKLVQRDGRLFCEGDSARREWKRGGYTSVCEMGEWHAVEECDAECGESAVVEYVRPFTGVDCQGYTTTQIKACRGDCNTKCAYSPWSPFSQCTKHCAVPDESGRMQGGTQTRTRTIEVGTPEECTAPLEDVRACNMLRCGPDGKPVPLEGKDADEQHDIRGGMVVTQDEATGLDAAAAEAAQDAKRLAEKAQDKLSSFDIKGWMNWLGVLKNDNIQWSSPVLIGVVALALAVVFFPSGRRSMRHQAMLVPVP